jgi:hypothetical protein
MLVTPAGGLSSYASLVRPPNGTQFNPIVCRLTGIFLHTLEKAPGWERVFEEFPPNRGALWVGFSSRSRDTLLAWCSASGREEHDAEVEDFGAHRLLADTGGMQEPIGCEFTPHVPRP